MPLQSNQIQESLTCSDGEIQTVISNLIQLNLNHQQNKEIIISSINQLIASAKTRLDGLDLLQKILPSCTADSSENFLKWINMCLVQQQYDVYKEIKLQTLADLVKYAPKDQEFNKKFVSDYLPKIVDSCINAIHTNEYEVEVALKCVNNCMKTYASSCLPFKNKTEAFVVKFLESENQDIVWEAGHSLLLLQQVGGAGIDAINHTRNFANQFKKLCATMHMLYDEFFVDITEIDGYIIPEIETYKFVDGDYDVQKQKHVLARRINNCIKFIMVMIQKAFPAPKETIISHLLDVIVRGLSIHYCLDKPETSIIMSHFSLLLNNIQLQLFKLLRLSLSWYQTRILPFSFELTKVILDCLKRTRGCNCFSVHSMYKEQVYKTWIKWTTIYSVQFPKNFQDDILSTILEDIREEKNQIVLTINDKSGMSSKAKAKAINKQIIDGRQTTLKNLSQQQIKIAENNCKFALTALKQFFGVTPFLPSNKIMDQCWNNIVATLIKIQTGKMAHPYKNPECQALLYEVLVSFYHHKTLSIKSVHIAINLLSVGHNSSDSSISSACQLGLVMLEKLCQPLRCSLEDPDLHVVRESEEEVIETPVVAMEEIEEEMEDVIPQTQEEKVTDQVEENPEKVVILSNEVIQEAQEPVLLDSDSPDSPVEKKPEEAVVLDSDSMNSPINLVDNDDLEIDETPVHSLTTQEVKEVEVAPSPAKKQKTSEEGEDSEMVDFGFVDEVKEY